MTSGTSRENRGTRNIPDASSTWGTICCRPVWMPRDWILCGWRWRSPNGSKIPSSASNSPAVGTHKDFTPSTTGKGLGRFSRDEFDNIELPDKNGRPIPRKPPSKAQSKALCGCIWNPRKAFPTFTVRFCRIDERGISTTTTTYTYLGSSGQPSVLALETGLDDCRQARETNIGQVNQDCMETLQSMESWSWDEYVARLGARDMSFGSCATTSSDIARLRAEERQRQIQGFRNPAGGANSWRPNLKAVVGKSCTRLPRQGLH